MNRDRMKIMMTIVNRGDGIALSRLYEQNGVPLHLQIAAEGTATSEILSMLGLTHKEKDLLLSFAPEKSIENLLALLSDDYRGILSVRGLAFSMRLQALSAAVDAALRGENTIKGGTTMVSDKSFSLILVAVNQGCTDLVMQTACKAGATGGTVVRGRWVGADHLEQFHGITIQDEKEVLAIVSSQEKRDAIMNAINESHGFRTEQQAVLCSVPLDHLVRLG